MGERKIINQLLKNHSIEEVAEMLNMTEKEVISLSKIKRINKEFKDKINYLYKEGKTATEISKELNLSRGTIVRHIENYKHIKRLVTSKQEEQIKIMYEKGKSYKYISKIMGLSDITIRKIIIKNVPGIKIKQFRRLSDEEIKILENLYNQGEKVTDIAEILNVHRSTIHRLIKKMINK